ncbi:arginine-tRNA ligase [Kockovaella imperatae]|uniref:arginine--tRNA ligase n=1 Tax=Kockovaella imperatae TaxID=4999 RepID=A0A1Y1UJQ6_9TREE|nr:arginine-tRNA ligase [Kockovaella imperatae]ORX38283.1 arginine-tRNA ligase [Kockovaella imperatae]
MADSTATSSTSAPNPAVNARYALPELPKVAGVDLERQPMDAFRLAVAKVVGEAWDMDPAKIFPAVDVGKKDADLTVAIPRFHKGGKPDEWAKKVVDLFKPSNALSALNTKGPFLLFTLNKTGFTYHMLRTISHMARDARENPTSHSFAFGTTDESKGKHMLIDFSSPNIAKPFHAGHLRSTIIGAVVANLHEAMGWKVTRLNYLGDWGTQYGLLSVGFDKYGSEEELVKDPIMHLFHVYVKINNENKDEIERFNKGEVTDGDNTIHAQAKRVFKAMEDGDPKAIAQWARFRDLSIEKLKETYERLNIHFDVFWGESKVDPESMQRAIRICEEKKLTCDDRGALLVDLTKWKMDRAIIRKGDGTTIYLTRDLGGAHDKFKIWPFDKHIIVVQAAQALHFRQLFKTLELMEEPMAGKIEHISFGLVKGMSTRKGTVVFLSDILDEATEQMHEQMRSNDVKYSQIEDPETTSRIIGETAVKIQDMSGKRVNDYDFNMKRCTSFEGDFGPFIQYSHVRLCSVQRKNPNVPVASSVEDIDLSVLDEPKIHDMIYHLSLYPTAVRNAYVQSEPSQLVNWCFRLGHLVGSAWETVKVSGAPEEEAKARLFMYIQVREVLASAMRLLSLTPIERM